MHRLTIAVVAALAALAVVSLSAAAHQRTRRAAGYPHRIVSLSPTATEDLFAIGAGKQVVAVDQDSDYPKRAPRTSLSGLNPDVEAIANYHPDLVLFSNGGPFVQQLRGLGIRVVVEPATKTITGEYAQIKSVGRITGHLSQARKLVASMARQMRTIVHSVPASRRHLRVFHELDPTYYSATSATFIGSIYKLFGFRNIADAADVQHTGYPQLSAEYILKANPQIIVLADGQTPAGVASRPGWNTVAAVRHHRVVSVNQDIASRWGPRIVQFARAVAKIARKG
ncbi:MAG TPA: ABC transporter substrate-binding protein [Gaiellaceae bacterium]|nr:ABC transporter substrate-binding protein [Gaiellaceae bacterium]